MGADGRNVESISQSRNISAFVPAWSTVFRESIIELGSVAPFSVVNPADAVQIIGGRPVIGSERIRRHARRKVQEPRPPQRLLYFPSFSRHKCLHSVADSTVIKNHLQIREFIGMVAPHLIPWRPRPMTPECDIRVESPSRLWGSGFQPNAT